MKIRPILLAGAASFALLSSACTTTNPAPGDKVVSHEEINAASSASLERLYGQVRGSRELTAKAAGVLIFPRVIAAGLGVGGEYGEGELIVNGGVQSYYRTTSLSVGLQAGAQSKALIFLFMTQDALNRFRASEGWTAGVDGSVAVLKVGANGDLDTTTIREPVQAFVLTNAGLMVNATIEGTKVSRIR